MATHDYIISNASGAAVRADLNNALAAIATNNSSATEPTTTYAYQWWADTGSSPTVMKLRNAANSGWVTLFQLDGEWTAIPFEDGTAAAPSIYFKNSGTDTGFYSPGVDQVGITTGGTVRLSASTTAITAALPINYPLATAGAPSVTFTGDLNTGLYSPGADQVAITTGGTQRATVDSSGRLLVGTGTARGIGSSVNWLAQIEAVAGGSTYPGLSVTSNSNDAESAHIVLGKSRGTSVGSNTIVQQNDVIGRIVFAGADGTDLETRAASIEGQVDGTPGANDMPGRLVFSTTADGASSPTERARIDSSGRLLVGTSSTSQTVTCVISGRSDSNTQDPILRFDLNQATPSSGQNLGNILFGTSSDSSGARGADIVAARDGGTWSASSKPTRLVFSTTADGASSPTERFRVDSSGSMVLASGSAFVAPYIYNTTTATAANVNVDASGFLRRSTSSIKYKTNVETIEDQYADAILGCRPVWYQSTCEADKPEWGHWGFIAEEVAEVDPRLCFFKEEEDGTLEPEGVQYDRFVPHLLNLIKRQKEQIEAMEARLSALEAQ